ncbi:hypothetical protein CsSME_00033252 [Camellia sinensis var. sinensis]
MESSSSSSSSSSRRSLLHTHTSTTSPQRFLSKRIEPAIRGKSCPICLNHIDHRRAAVITACLHAYCVDCIRRWSDLKRNCPLCNAVFDAWFSQINLSSRTFLKHKLPEISEDIRKLNVEVLRSRRRVLVAARRVLRRLREEFDCVNGRTMPLPRQRWFGRSGSESSNSVAEGVLQWRASIYEQHLRAVPCFSQSCLERVYSLAQATEIQREDNDIILFVYLLSNFLK